MVVEAPDEAPAKGLLWRISVPDKPASYLFGTIHVIPSESFFLPEGTREAIDSSAAVFFEVDLSLMDEPAEQMAVLTQSFMKDDLTLKDLVSGEEYALIKAHFDKLGIPLFFLERVKPMFLTVFADNSLFSGPMDQDKLRFYELEISGLAKERGKEIRGLESIELQMGIMDSIPYQEQAQMLVESIRAGDEGNAQMDSLVMLYTDQDLEGLIGSFQADSLSRYDSLLLIDRNHNWIPLMEEAMQDRSCFFAVGAAHLPGPDGVIALLRKEGYMVRPVN